MDTLKGGFDLIYLGMGTVFVTLGALAVLIMLMEKVFYKRRKSPGEAKVAPDSLEERNEILACVITAAMEEYRGSKDFRLIRIVRSQGEWNRMPRATLANSRPRKY